MPNEYLTTIDEGRRRVQRGKAEPTAGQVVDDRALDRDRDADQDPGSYIGRMPERATETIPGGVTDADERVAAHSTQPGPTAGRPAPSGHREGPPATDDTVREAGQDR